MPKGVLAYRNACGLKALARRMKVARDVEARGGENPIDHEQAHENCEYASDDDRVFVSVESVGRCAVAVIERKHEGVSEIAEMRREGKAQAGQGPERQRRDEHREKLAYDVLPGAHSAGHETQARGREVPVQAG